MIRCNNCGTNNIDGSEYCDECGMKLDLNVSPRGRERAEPIYQPPSAVDSDPAPPPTMDAPTPTPPSFTTSTSIPKPAMPAHQPRNSDQDADGGGNSRPRNPSRRPVITDESSGPQRSLIGRRSRESKLPDSPAGPLASQTFSISSRGRTDPLESDSSAPPAADNSHVNARLVIERGGRVGREFSVTAIETNIGRWDADSGIFPDVDLDEDDPEAKISRRHARIINHNGQFFIEDLGSTNGTFVNRGRRLLPGKRHMLQSGDEIIVGKTFLKFQVIR